MIDSNFGKSLSSKANCILRTLFNRPNSFPIFGCILSTISRLIVGVRLFLKIVMMTSHVFLAFFLVFRSLSCDWLFVVINIVSGG